MGHFANKTHSNGQTVIFENRGITFISKYFEIKDLWEDCFILGIQIQREKSRGILGLSQKSYIDIILERFGMQTTNQVTPLLLKETNSITINALKLTLNFEN